MLACTPHLRLSRRHEPLVPATRQHARQYKQAPEQRTSRHTQPGCKWASVRLATSLREVGGRLPLQVPRILLRFASAAAMKRASRSAVAALLSSSCSAVFAALPLSTAGSMLQVINAMNAWLAIHQSGAAWCSFAHLVLGGHLCPAHGAEDKAAAGRQNVRKPTKRLPRSGTADLKGSVATTAAIEADSL